MILKFDVTKLIPFVPKSHSSIEERELYVLDTSLYKKDVFQLIKEDAEVTFYKVNGHGDYDRNLLFKFKPSELKPAITTVRNIDGKSVDVIFE